jgi:hypothetical protein
VAKQVQRANAQVKQEQGRDNPGDYQGGRCAHPNEHPILLVQPAAVVLGLGQEPVNGISLVMA